MHQAKRERSRQERYRQRREALEKANALQAQRIAQQEIAARTSMENEAAAVELQKSSAEADRARGTARVIAGEAGAFGG